MQLAAAPALKPPDGEVVVVTDPHFNGLVTHGIVGHPSEADRALKMEAASPAEAGSCRRSSHNEIGQPVRLARCSRHVPIRRSTATAIIATTTKGRAGAA